MKSKWFYVTSWFIFTWKVIYIIYGLFLMSTLVSFSFLFERKSQYFLNLFSCKKSSFWLLLFFLVTASIPLLFLLLTGFYLQVQPVWGGHMEHLNLPASCPLHLQSRRPCSPLRTQGMVQGRTLAHPLTSPNEEREKDNLPYQIPVPNVYEKSLAETNGFLDICPAVNKQYLTFHLDVIFVTSASLTVNPQNDMKMVAGHGNKAQNPL